MVLPPLMQFLQSKVAWYGEMSYGAIDASG